MPMKAKRKARTAKASTGLWISPRHILKGPAGERAWENRPGGPPNSGKFLELADIALGIKKSSSKKSKSAAGTHITSKNEPYSS